MSPGKAGQRCLSEREPELGLGVVASVDPAARRVAVEFPGTGEKRLYALGTAVLRRVLFRPGETVADRAGRRLVITAVEETDGLATYVGADRRLREDEIADATSVSRPHERLLAGEADETGTFDLRRRALEARARFRQSEVRGFLGGRIDLIPHQFHILAEVAGRQAPRVLLADEVGLGKTIEACLILQRLLATGRARRVLILVPEALTHQWFVELLRRFNLWFSILDETRCQAAGASDPGRNPFLGAQLVLCSVGFLAGLPGRRAEAVAAGWDVVVVDEAHHLAWTPEAASPEYALVEELAAVAPGLLLLTATPTQLGVAGHFARLRLLDPQRFADLARFEAEAEGYARVADVAGKVIEGRPLTAADRAALRKIFDRDPGTLATHLEHLAAGRPGAREALLRTLLDQHGTGRVVFRNTRAAMTGFPRRRYCPAPLEGAPVVVHARLARELRAEAAGEDADLRPSFRDDPRVAWLAAFLRRERGVKALLICRTQRKVLALAAALQEVISAKVALFHEGLPLVQRDRNAAWFAEPDGAQLLLSSEIGSEGRNFQFAHHLILLDLPLNPALLEQRIGRLDRIGQGADVHIHVPYLAGGAGEVLATWYDQGLDAFAAPVHGGHEYEAAFRERLVALATTYAPDGEPGPRELAALVAETAAFRATLRERLQRGRDRLLELNSFDRAAAAAVVAKVQAADADPFPRRFLVELLDHFGVRIREHEEGDLFLDPSHAYVEGFPSLPADGMLATFDRRRALAREDIRFLTADHPLVGDAIDLLLESPAGTAACASLPGEEPDLLLEVLFVLETVADARWHVDEFLPPAPVRVVVDLRGRDRTAEHPAAAMAAEAVDRELRPLLERPGFNGDLLRAMLEAAEARADAAAASVRAAAAARADAVLAEGVARLESLRRINDTVRPAEIELAAEQRRRIGEAIGQARLRLDAVRLLVVGDPDDE